MGASVFAYPRAYADLIPRLRQVMGARAARIGVALNFEKVCGCPISLLYSQQYAKDMAREWPRCAGAPVR
jgi:hypothetical protein